jgi:hypothetical protein
MKLTKQLALELANTIELSALESHEELHPNDVRAIAEGLYEGQLDSFQFGMLTDWAYTIADARLGWRRRRRALRGQTGKPAGDLQRVSRKKVVKEAAARWRCRTIRGRQLNLPARHQAPWRRDHRSDSASPA